MINWIKDNKENILQTSKLIGLLLIIFLIFKAIPNTLNKAIDSNFDSESIGIIDSISIREGIIDTSAGSKVMHRYFTLYYRYHLDDKRFKKDYKFDIQTLSRKSAIKLRTLESSDTMTILYKSKNPEISRPKLD